MTESAEKGYKKLKVWQKANEFALSVYQTTKNFPREELYGITSQIRRAALSTAANIVEGQASSSKKDFLRYLGISNKSLVECEYLLELSKTLNYINQVEYTELENIRKETAIVLFAFMMSVKNKL